jgi:hypothetical protein
MIRCKATFVSLGVNGCGGKRGFHSYLLDGSSV